MSLRAFKWGIFLFMLMALGALGVVVFSVDPTTAGLAGLLLFFASFFAWFLGISMSLLLFVYTKGLGEERTAKHLGGIFRQAFLLSLFFLGNLLLLYGEVWTWWMSLLFFCFILLLELTARHLGGREEKK